MITKMMLEKKEMDILRAGETISLSTGRETILLCTEANVWDHANGSGNGKRVWGTSSATLLEIITKKPGLRAKTIIEQSGLPRGSYGLLNRLQHRALAKRDKKTGGWYPAIDGKFSNKN